MNIDFQDINIGYEQVAQNLKKIGLDWEMVRDHGIECKVMIGSREPQLAFELPASPTMANGEATIAFGIYAGIFDGLKQTMAHINSGPGKKRKIQSMAHGQNSLLIHVGS